MKVQCSGCRATISVPDEKVPEGRTIRVLCPKCRNPIQVSRKTDEELAEAVTGDGGGTVPHPGGASLSSPPTPPTTDLHTVDMVEEGVEKALVYLTDVSVYKRVEHALQQMDYYISYVQTVQQAVAKLSSNPYDMVIIDDNVLNPGKGEESFYQYARSLPMYIQRTFLLCLISGQYSTLDQLTAFKLGVNLILNARDLEKTRMVFERAMRDYRKTYRAFETELKKLEE